MQKAFSMIELIFVIVIIGILTAVAIPKLTATRDDAKVAAIAQNVSIAAQDITSYAFSQGTTLSNFSNMSNAVLGMIQRNEAVQINNVLNISMNTVSDCLQLKVVTDTKDSNLTISYGNAGNDTLCQSLQDAINDEDYPIPLKGRRIKL